ncbi:hypothetical protein, partial [Escherichia coli]|uniref:hypothetical protein n=1 Tax=Escherichia coli TaxID=562 RepID=UPI0032DB8B95
IFIYSCGRLLEILAKMTILSGYFVVQIYVGSTSDLGRLDWIQFMHSQTKKLIYNCMLKMDNGECKIDFQKTHICWKIKMAWEGLEVAFVSHWKWR